MSRCLCVWLLRQTCAPSCSVLEVARCCPSHRGPTLRRWQPTSQTVRPTFRIGTWGVPLWTLMASCKSECGNPCMALGLLLSYPRAWMGRLRLSTLQGSVHPCHLTSDRCVSSRLAAMRCTGVHPTSIRCTLLRFASLRFASVRFDSPQSATIHCTSLCIASVRCTWCRAPSLGDCFCPFHQCAP